MNILSVGITMGNVGLVLYVRARCRKTKALLEDTRARQDQLARFYRTVTLCKPVRTEDYPLIFPPVLEGRLQNPLVGTVPRRSDGC